MFQTRFKELRESAGYRSQQALADALGISQSTIGNWESGRRGPKRTTAVKLANFFGVSVDYLLGLDDTQEKPTPVAGSGLTPEFVRLYEQLSEEEQALVVKQMKGLLAED